MQFWGLTSRSWASARQQNESGTSNVLVRLRWGSVHFLLSISQLSAQPRIQPESWFA
jgi:hypothetical protein